MDTTTETKSESIALRLRTKFQDINNDHRTRCECLSKLDQKILETKSELANIPMKQSMLHEEIEKLDYHIAQVEKVVQDKKKVIETLKGKEEITLSKLQLRRNILDQVCTKDENNIVNDAIDIKTAEIRHLQTCVQREIDMLCEKQDVLRKEQDRLNNEISNSASVATKARLQNELVNLYADRKVAETLVSETLSMLRECQRILEDYDERENMENYAKENGLVNTSGTTDELIHICRDHQEKIAKKNKEADNNSKNSPSKAHACESPSSTALSVGLNLPMVPALLKAGSTKPQVPSEGLTRPEALVTNQKYSKKPKPKGNYKKQESVSCFSTNSSSSSSEGEDEGDCSCTACRGAINVDCSTCNPSFDRSNFNQKKNEISRRQNGFTIAGAANARKKETPYNSKNDNGWTPRLW